MLCLLPRARAALWAQRITVALLFVAVLLASAKTSAAQEVEGFEGWNLEPGLGQAHLVMVARVESISRVTIVEGAKTDVPLREFRFQPVKRLKGIFQRDELSMTASDLGISAEDAASAPPLKEGEYRLLILVQPRGLNTLGCVAAAPGATTFEERVPKLTGPEDPLVSVAETLIQVADSRSRKERAKLLVDRFLKVDGLARVLLLTSLRSRADWAAEDGRLFGPVQNWAGGDPAPSELSLALRPAKAVRSGAVLLLRDMLATGVIPEDEASLGRLAKGLREFLNSDKADTRDRLTALEALDHLLKAKPEVDWAREYLTAQLTGAATHAERAAAVTALSRIPEPEATKAVGLALENLLLDEPPAREAVYAHAMMRLDKAAAEEALLARLNKSIAAGQSLQGEVRPLAELGSKKSLPMLLMAAEQRDLLNNDRQQIAWALGILRDDRAVPVLVRWLRSSDYGIKEVALTALENIDSDLAAREVRPLLRKEPQLAYKLRMARLLARHGINDGYALATEHLADDGHTAAAALVLAALDDPRTAKDLSEIIANRPDRRWHAAALTGLVAIGDEAARNKLLEILTDDRHPLAADAAEAVGVAADSELLRPLAKLVQSRNTQIARASLLALRRYLSGVRMSPRGLAAVGGTPDVPTLALGSNIFGEWAPTAKGPNDEWLDATAHIPMETREALLEAVAALAGDAYVDAAIRQEALTVARLLGGDRYEKLLAELAAQAELESSSILRMVQEERRR